jgi:hypothetical protein
MKFRITQIIYNPKEFKNENFLAKTEYIIEKKTFWGWCEIFQKEINPKRNSFNTYEAAEAYMFSKYMGHGLCKINGNEYSYEPYEYYH